MCGILAVFSRNKSTDTACLNALHRMEHRGPDSFGYYSTAQGFIGHRRLAIVGVENGQQPLFSEDKGIKAVVNGAFYNYKQIRKDLRQKGHHFATASDSEILLHLYEEYGEKCLDYLEGEFAFILWDEAKKKVFAVRDRFGVKPLCYAQWQGELIIASEMKAILALGLPAEWNIQALQTVFTSQYLPKNGTLIKGIKQLEPGYFLSYEKQQIQLRQYWDIPKQNTKTKSEASIYDLLEKAVQKRLDCEVPVACHLSGGIDSAAIAALVAKQRSQSIDCFTVIFPQEGYNEWQKAQAQAQYIGANLHAVEVKTEELIANYEEAVRKSESLAINGQLVAKYTLNKAVAKAGCKVVLGGEGADEVLFGYPHLKQDYYGGQSEEVLLQQNHLLKGIMLDDYGQADFQQVQQKLGYVPAFFAAKLKLGNRLSEVLSDEIGHLDGAALFLDQYQLDESHLVEKSRYLWTKSAFANYILLGIGDGTEMANSVEGRLPFLDKDLVDYAATLPFGELFNNGIEKHILRKAMEGAVVDSIRNSPKHPFIAPPIDLYSNKQGIEFISDLFHSTAFAELPFVDVQQSKKLVQRMKTAPDSEKIKYDAVVHTLISLTMFSQTIFSVGQK